MAIAQSGVQMMLKALGIEIDPEMINQAVEMVKSGVATLVRIEEKLDKVLASQGKTNGNGNGAGKT